MHFSVRDRLIREAIAIEQFRNLHPEEQEWLLPLLSRGVRSTVETLNLVSDKIMTFEEVGKELGINSQTVSQKLNALAQGGIDIQLTDMAAFAPIGRLRKLARKLSAG